MYWGDNPKADIPGAKNAGMKIILKYNLSWQTAKAADAIVDKLHKITLILDLFKGNRSVPKLMTIQIINKLM